MSTKKPNERGLRLNAALSAILIVLLSVTILAVLVMGGMFVMRITKGAPPPTITDPSISTDTKSPDTAAPNNTDASSADTDAPSTSGVTDAPVTDAPATEPATEPVTDAPDVPANTSSVFLPETADGGDEYLKRIVFLGDSTTYHMHHFTDHPSTQIWVPQSATLELSDMLNKSVAMPVEGVDYRDWVDMPISNVLSSRKPDILIVTLGINFSTYYSKEEYGWTMEKKEAYFKLQISNIKNLVDQNSPDTKLIFQTIYPVIDSELIEDGSPIRNEHIKIRNSWLIEICEELNIPVLKTEDVLMDENGELKKEYNSYHLDGYHVNAEAYEAIFKYVRTHTVP